MSSLCIQEFNSLDQLGSLRKEWDVMVARAKLGPAHEFDWLNRHQKERYLLGFHRIEALLKRNW